MERGCILSFAVANGDVLVGTATVVGDTVTLTFSRNRVLQTFGD
jgi:hypothetical protein